MDSAPAERLPVGTVKSREAKPNFIRLVIDYEPIHDQVLSRLFGVGQPAVVAPITPEAAQEDQQTTFTETARPFGDEAKALRLSSFFRIPEVWRAVGDDRDFLAWLETRPCVVCKQEPPSFAAHVRRVANGAGTGIKPEYSAVALCDPCHKTQHQKGESALADKGQWDRWRIEALVAWGWAALKDGLGYGHWYDVPPAKLYAWAAERNLERYLPVEYLP